ncbi:MAG: hypothetical protein ACT4PY_10420 [Armatimonadota bacterium]
MKSIAGFVVAAVLVLGAGAPTYSQADYGKPPGATVAPGGGVKVQLKTAITHAGFAAAGDSAGYVRQHLGHALNCIEGPNGKNFNRAWGHVCQGQGNGILQDLRSAPGGATFTIVIEHADSLAAAGVTRNDLAEAKAAAKATQALLSVINDTLK